MSADRNSNPTGSKHKKPTPPKHKATKNKDANDALDDITFDSTMRVGMSNRQPPGPDSPGWKEVRKIMEQCDKAKDEKKKKEIQAGERKP
ncbi:hypothetical protein BCON_0054g00320 [Botryotinia convoluta]|uniref:Uncharacterized protein n=1 Tax=Botryotinia convoluta TaxID=54673 RepID=A0A4Z1IFU1_9HELO|nr:hypothetical protein BCON_0054g00320 [Botryotinia convoluta]